MRIAYVLDRPEVSGGVKVVLQHASLLQQAGHDAVVIASGARPAWHPFDADYADASAGPPRLPAQDLVVGTFWSTVATARALDVGPVAHFCQGYEGDLEHLADAVPAIEAVYRGRAPLLVVADHLADLVRERFGRASRVVSPPLDAIFQPAERTTPRARPRVMIPGIFEAPVKGVRTALAAVRRLEASGLPCDVTRVSMLPLSPAEAAIRAPDRYLHGVAPPTVAAVMREMDLLIAASGPAEGFGLPVLEALASGVPVVTTDIPAMRAHDTGALARVPPGDDAALADAARGLLLDPERWRARRAAGLASVDRFRPDAIIGPLEQGLAWGGGGGQPMTPEAQGTVVILGQYKTGTTALFSRVRDAVPGTPRALHEVDDYLPEPDDAGRWVVAKVILGMPDAGSRVRYDTFRRFDRQLYLVRDPRDWMVSGALFLTQQLRSVYADREHLDRVLALLHEKEASPHRVSMLTLLRTIVEREPGESVDWLIGWMGRQHDWLITFEESLGDHARVRYEDMVAGRLGAAQAHLGFALPPAAVLAPEHQHVPRTRGAGHWRHWLTPADVDHFRPVFAAYMDHYGYSDDWELANAPSIDPAHGSAYVTRVTGRRRASEGLDPP